MQDDILSEYSVHISTNVPAAPTECKMETAIYVTTCRETG
jgi:hypothetical protein